MANIFSAFWLFSSAPPHSGSQYTAFGKVIEGMDVVNKIADTSTDCSDKPLEDQVMQSITVDTFGVEYSEPEKL